MDVKRLFLSSFVAMAVVVSAVAGLQLQSASAEVPGTKVPPTLAAAIRADIEARGYQYGGDCKFDSMYLAPGMWCSAVQSLGADGATVTFGRFASDEVKTAKFVREGAYGWVNPETGVGAGAYVPALHASPGSKADSWTIVGINFKPLTEVTFFDGSGCGGEQRCPTDHTLGTITAGPDGGLEIVLQLNPAANPVPGQVNRLIQASNGSFIQVPFHHSGSGPVPTPIGQTPSEPVATPTSPAPANPTPVNPTPNNPEPTKPAPTQPSQPTPDDTDSDDGDNDTKDLVVWSIAALAAASLGALGIMTVSRRR